MSFAVGEFCAVVRIFRHLNAERWLSAYADGEAPPSRTRAVERHLAECPDCQSVVDFIVASKLVLRRAGGRATAGDTVRCAPTDG